VNTMYEVYTSDSITRQTKRGRGRKRLICALAHNFFALAGNIFEGVVREIFSGCTQQPEQRGGIFVPAAKQTRR
jgi:hypothetical protein